ncbi:MAG TPA: sulfotransferase domain-containing protein [Anaerolineae bacterium]|nr:sulfotransferase domain-containing protein [Anaerolineae bacterium]
MSGSKFPPLWAIPKLLTTLPRMTWYRWRKNYIASMAAAREIFGSAKIKTRGFRGYTPSKHDAFVCTYSKSGTYWMMQIVTQIAGKGSAEFEHIHDIVPWPEMPVPGPVRLPAPTWQTAVTQIRAIKTHAEAEFVPYNKAAKYIVVMRDPKDVVVSSFYFSEAILPGTASLGREKWVALFLSNQTPYGSWPEHTAGFWPWRERDNVHIVTFAALKQDLAKEVATIAAFLEVDLDQQELAQVVERSSFAYMKKHEAKFEPPAPTKNGTNLIRKGKKGESAEFLTAAQRQQIDEAMRTQLQTFGSDFPYDDYFASD